MRPILFLTYINGLKDITNVSCITCSAGITVVLMFDENWKDVYKLVAIKFVKIKKRLDINVPRLNMDKTTFFTFTTSSFLLPIIEQIIIHDDNCLDIPNCSCTNCLHRIDYIKGLWATFIIKLLY